MKRVEKVSGNKTSITEKDVVYIQLTTKELSICIDNAKSILDSIVDRTDLHDRDNLERFNNLLMGEIAEQMIMKWLRENGKFAILDIEKNKGGADKGHDILLKQIDTNRDLKCSVKSSLSYKHKLPYIISKFRLATTLNEIRDVNIQVYFWLDLTPSQNAPRTTVPTLKNSAIIGWFGSKDLEKSSNSFSSYNHERRQSPEKPLKYARPMSELLNYIK